MEAGSEGEKKKPPEGENKTKRKMKTASQLEILEKTYAVESYPSESLRAELSSKLGLSDRQLQMWFCHRRLKDRKVAPVKRSRKESPVVVGIEGGSGGKMVVGDVGNEHISGLGLGSSSFGHSVDSRRVLARPSLAVPRIGGDIPFIKRYYEPQQSIVELRAIAFVEAQLGEPLREDGPILGMEFDPLPPDAFGTPIGTSIVGQQKQSARSFDAKIYDQSDAKSVKVAARALHEYQFIPEQPTVRLDSYERFTPSYQYGSPLDGPNAKTSSIPTGHLFIHGNEQLPSGYGFQGEYDKVQRKNTKINMDAHPISQLENPFMLSDRRVTHDEDVIRVERKRKSEEAKIAREVEAHEKRIRKELEKQDILRRKREEQIRKEMERHDRERRKEEERLLREKQREEERYQREQRRELERREKFLLKESIRAEKMRQKEELRREKEAARLKAANERAIARRIAKESMELIEDERLELMELAASSKGLPSIASLDYESLQNLDSYRDMRNSFPPKSVHLKRPFAIQPWAGSEENIGNLLMVWRFLITFADVLGLWPFTLDEFIQAFHDYDSRLLGEIHVSLLRSIIKDIEDVARTPSMGLGANQNGTANPGGGHPEIVEGAYAWGFDIRSWQHNLNPLTWPEILRQFALSAGLGPQLKKRNVEPVCLRDDNEGNDGKDIISNLRNGAAVENAFAIMQERGFSNPRRSRHRLTPGTVKFAAFHVLSLEGNKGLTILEVADRIQKSGLRDLTTSKTPEASIAAALSRDSKLFERTAPSTYCVRASYRKDPADAESILASARERIRIFKSGVLDGEDAEDAERDDDSESDAAEDPEVDDLGTEINPIKEAGDFQELNKFNAKTLLGNGKESSHHILETPEKDLRNIDEGLSAIDSEGHVKMKDTSLSYGQTGQTVDVAGMDASTIDQEDADIDGSHLGEPWVQGLMEGEYSDLSVEERLNALAALIGVAIEGNSIRLILEVRLEAANALKKQMWAEVQLDKRRMKEEYIMRMHYSSLMGNKFEPNVTNSSAGGGPSPFLTVGDKNNETTVDLSVQEEQINDLHTENNYISSFPSERNLQMQEVPTGPDNHLFPQSGCAADRSRSQLKSYIGYKAEEMYVYRSLPLGQDRRRNRYWQFITSASPNDPGCGRIFVELQDGRWRLIDSEEGFDALLASLDVRGIRESQLHTMLQKIGVSFKKIVKKSMLHDNVGRECEHNVKKETVEMTLHPDFSIGNDSPSSTVCLADSDMLETSTSFVIELGRNEIEKNSALKRYQDLEKWIWKECFSSSMICAIKDGKKRCKQLLNICDYCSSIYSSEDNHCPSCHRIYATSESGFNFSEHLAQCKRKLKLEEHCALHGSSFVPQRIRMLKMLLSLVEVSVPPEALQSLWTESHRKSWGIELTSSSSAKDLLQVLTVLEGAVKRDYLSSNFETTNELLDSSNPVRFAATNSTLSKSVTILPWIPLTTAAVALRLMEFDAAISYTLQQKVESRKNKESGDLNKHPSTHAVLKSSVSAETLSTTCQANNLQEENWADPGIGLDSFGRGRGSRGGAYGRTRSGRSQRRAIGSRAESVKHNAATNNERLGQVLEWEGRSRGHGHRRGRRSIRSRQKPSKKMVEIGGERSSPKEGTSDKSPRSLVNAWNRVETANFQLEGAELASSSGRSEYDDENGQASEDEYDDMVVDDYATGLNGKSDDLLDGSDYNVNGDEDEADDDVEDEEEDGEGDFDVDRYINGDSDGEENRAGDEEQNMKLNEGTGSTSSEYSD
ncbi:homeobox-DDT domain protein RLT2 isoform X2 [Ziziphus jujuba]|uniref:Homeobox-DDT domain protein RLT2 isoform X2 n=1 Tax=Ziziphus jujuba TaxID=326968 RepID=A0ABM3IHH2_ZIZJJ|nr:homeobox-DDT domain protein RLT2 isoform X2 [Ziziphus jujuba]